MSARILCAEFHVAMNNIPHPYALHIRTNCNSEDAHIYKMPARILCAGFQTASCSLPHRECLLLSEKRITHTGFDSRTL